jgi:predicted membrane chloride channel (bestrophin family)
MIVYDHIPLPARFLQFKGTVLTSTMWHVLLISIDVSFVWWVMVRWKPAFLSGVTDTMEESASPLLWTLLMLPLGFLLGLRSNQAYMRFMLGVENYTHLVCAAMNLARQASSYIRYDGQYRNPEPGMDPEAGYADYEDPHKQRIIRHVVAFVAAVRQDIRNRRLHPPESEAEQREQLVESRLHLTQPEIDYLVRKNAFDDTVHTPLVISRWLSDDIACVVDRVGSMPLIATMENSLERMVESFHNIDQIAIVPVPWPYTHLTQFFLMLWVYTLPICMVQEYGLTGSIIGMSFLAIILFGMDAVAREIQDPFGFDDNDLNIHGYENHLIAELDTILKGDFKVLTCDHDASTCTSSAAQSHFADRAHEKGVAMYMDAHELTAGTEGKENLWSLHTCPCSHMGSFDDAQLAKESKHKHVGYLHARTQSLVASTKLSDAMLNPMIEDLNSPMRS